MSSNAINCAADSFFVKAPFFEQTLSWGLDGQHGLEAPVQKFNFVTGAVKDSQSRCSDFVNVIIVDTDSQVLGVVARNNTVSSELHQDNHVKACSNKSEIIKWREINGMNVKVSVELMHALEVLSGLTVQKLLQILFFWMNVQHVARCNYNKLLVLGDDLFGDSGWFVVQRIVSSDPDIVTASIGCSPCLMRDFATDQRIKTDFLHLVVDLLHADFLIATVNFIEHLEENWQVVWLRNDLGLVLGAWGFLDFHWVFFGIINFVFELEILLSKLVLIFLDFFLLP